MEITTYKETYKNEIIDLILRIQNDESGIDLSLEEQPDLNDIAAAYQKEEGEFWVALDGGRVIGTIGIMNKGNRYGILKKFFVDAEYRGQKVGLNLYRELLNFAREHGIQHVILDTPSVAKESHTFYARAGFRQIAKEDLPIPYEFPDRDSLLFLLDI